MYENDVPKSGTSLRERARKKLTHGREKLTLDARTRFILLFALFNAMLCLLLLVSLENMGLVIEQKSLKGEIRRLRQAQETIVAEAATQVAGVRETAVADTATQIAEFKASPLIAPTYSSTVAPASVLRTPTADTSIQSTPTGTVAVTPTVPADPPPLLFSITPNTGTIAASAITATLQGSGFAPGAMVEIQKEGESPVVAEDLTVINPTQIIFILDLTRAATGMWSVRVINPDHQFAILPNALRVYPARSP